MSTKTVMEPAPKWTPADTEALLRQYGCGPIKFSGNDGLYERHLQFDNVIDDRDVNSRERFEAGARSVRDRRAQGDRRSAGDGCERAARAGIQQGLHNEEFELSSVNGERTYDILLRLLDPKLVKFQFQVSTISRGYDAAEYFTKYPGRFISMHVQGWSAKTRKIVPVGQGTLDWKKIFSAAKTGGIQNYFVEMDLPMMQASVPYLRQLQV